MPRIFAGTDSLKAHGGLGFGRRRRIAAQIAGAAGIVVYYAVKGGLRNMCMLDKEVNAARQRLRRFGWATGARTRSASSDCIARAVSPSEDLVKDE